MSIYLGLNQNQVNEKHHKIVLDVFIRETFAAWTLCKTDAFAEGTVVGAGVGRVKGWKREAAMDADGHVFE